MDNVPAILVYLVVSLLAPIGLSRLIIRADWKTIRIACLLWYGFLFLAFAAFKSAEHFGWVLIFAMFFSIPVVPLISAVLKLLPSVLKLLKRLVSPDERP